MSFYICFFFPTHLHEGPEASGGGDDKDGEGKSLETTVLVGDHAEEEGAEEHADHVGGAQGRAPKEIVAVQTIVGGQAGVDDAAVEDQVGLGAGGQGQVGLVRFQFFGILGTGNVRVIAGVRVKLALSVQIR